MRSKEISSIEIDNNSELENTDTILEELKEMIQKDFPELFINEATESGESDDVKDQTDRIE